MSNTEIETPHQIGRYQVRGIVGRGAMGVVYEAVDASLGRPVAIKTMSFAKCPDENEFRARFLREARALGSLQHPNLITVHELLEEGPVAYMVMELLEGASLHALIQRKKAFTLGEKLSIVDQVAAGLAEAHEHSIVHRDLKPGNVFVQRSGVVKVLDFGVAKIGEGELTRAGTVFGSVEYMAPEQVRGFSVTSRADVFALGVLAYELLTGFNPFRADTLAASVFKIISDTPEPFASKMEGLPSGVEQIVFRALAKEERDRFASLPELRGALSDVVEKEGLRIEAPTLTERDIELARSPAAADALVEAHPSQWSNVAAKADRLEELYRAGVACFQNGEYEQAVAKLSEVLDEVPIHAMSLHYLASSEEKLRNDRLSDDDHQRASEILARMRDAHRRGDASLVVERANEVLKIDRESLEARWYRRNAEARMRASTVGARPVPPSAEEAYLARALTMGGSGSGSGSGSGAEGRTLGRGGSFGYVPGAAAGAASHEESSTPLTRTRTRTRPIDVPHIEPHTMASATPIGHWLLGGVALVFVALVGLWIASFQGAGPSASAKPEAEAKSNNPVAIPGVRTSPFDNIDEDGTVVLQLPVAPNENANANANSQDTEIPSLDRIIPTTVPLGETVTVGLFGNGFTEATPIRVSANAELLAVRLESSELIEVELVAKPAGASSNDTEIEILVGDGQQGQRATLRIEIGSETETR
jgi:serine/threonine protein kinase